MSEITKAEKLARAMDGVMSGGRAFNRQLAAQIRDELRRMDRRVPAPAVPDDVVEPVFDVAAELFGAIYVEGARYYPAAEFHRLEATIEAQAAELARIRSLSDALVNHPGWGTVNYTDGDMWADADKLRAALTHTAAQPAPAAVAEATHWLAERENCTLHPRIFTSEGAARGWADRITVNPPVKITPMVPALAKEPRT